MSNPAGKPRTPRQLLAQAVARPRTLLRKLVIGQVVAERPRRGPGGAPR